MRFLVTLLVSFILVSPTLLVGQEIVLPPAEAYAPGDTQTVLNLNEEFKKYYANDPVKAEEIGLHALALADTLDFAAGISKLSNNLGVFYSNQGNYERALEYHRRNLSILEQVDNRPKLGNCLNNIGTVLYEQGRSKEALREFRRAYALHKEFNDTTGSAHVLNNVGSILMDMGRFPDALKMFLESSRLREIQGDSLYMPHGYLNIGKVYQHQKRLELAESYFLKALKVSTSLGNNYVALDALIDLSSVVGMDSNRKEEAFLMLHQARQMAYNVSDQFGQIEANIGLAEEFQLEGTLDSAFVYAQEALTTSIEIKRAHGEGRARFILGSLYLQAEDFDEALHHLNRTAEITESNEYNEMARDNYKLLAKANAAIGEFELAYQQRLKFFEIHQEIFSSENNAKLLELREQYEVGEKEQTISELEYRFAQDELRIARGRFFMTLSIATVVFLLGVAGVLWYRARKKQQLAEMTQQQKEAVEEQKKWTEDQNAQILEINNNLGKMVETRTAAVRATKEELDVFLYQSAHALRRPVVRIRGLFSLIDAKLNDPADEIVVDSIRISLQDMDQLLHQLVQVNEVERRDPVLEPVDLKSTLDEVCTHLDFRGGQVELDAPKDFALLTDSFLLAGLFERALENSIKFSEGPVQVKVQVEEHLDKICLRISDQGRGCPEEEREKLFEMFYRADNRTRGNGLGLYLIRKISERLHGEAHVTPAPATGGFQLEIHLPPHVL